MKVRASYSPFNMVFSEKTVSGTFYGSVRPDRRLSGAGRSLHEQAPEHRRPDQPHLQLADINEGFKRMMAAKSPAASWCLTRTFAVKRFLAILLPALLLASVEAAAKVRPSGASPAIAGHSAPGPMAHCLGDLRLQRQPLGGGRDGKRQPRLPFYFLFAERNGQYRLSGEGTGSPEITRKAYADLMGLTQQDILALVKETQKASPKPGQ